MKKNRNIIIAVTALILILWTAVIPAAAEFVPEFSWQVYRIDTEKWTEYPDYIKYSGTIYEVHFTDETTGGTPTAWNWEFSEEDWWGSSKKNPVYIYTEEEVDAADDRFKVTLKVNDNSGNFGEVYHYVYVIEDPWNPYPIYEKTPKPTATPTTVATTAPPTTVATTIPTTPTAEPTEPPAFTANIPGISGELNKLKTAFNDHLQVIIQIFRNIGLVKD